MLFSYQEILQFYRRRLWSMKVMCILIGLLTFFEVYLQQVSLVNSTTSVVCDDVARGDGVRCRQYAGTCYNRSDTCVFDRRVVDAARGFEVQMPCRDGSQLRNDCGMSLIIVHWGILVTWVHSSRWWFESLLRLSTRQVTTLIRLVVVSYYAFSICNRLYNIAILYN